MQYVVGVCANWIGWSVEPGKEHDIFRYLRIPQQRIVVPRHRDLPIGVARDIAKTGRMEREVTFYVGIFGRLWRRVGREAAGHPGCVGAGVTPEDAIMAVTGALREVAAYKKSGEFEVPKPRSITEIVASGEIEAGEATVMIPLLVDSGRTVRANVTFDAVCSKRSTQRRANAG